MSKAGAVLEEVKKAVVGKDEVLVQVLLAILAGGHILLEDIPGVGKTTMALAFSRALALEYNRVQFTPDVLPSDITGFSLYNKHTGAMEYQPGAVLCNLFLADELNRATSRTQSALLEAMEEGGVTVDSVRQVLGHDELRALRAQVAGLYMNTAVMQYIVRLVRATRRHAQVVQGASPRATLALAAMAKAAAFARGCDYVAPRDVQAVFSCTIAHRLLLAPEAKSAQDVCEEVLQGIKAPQLR